MSQNLRHILKFVKFAFNLKVSPLAARVNCHIVLLLCGLYHLFALHDQRNHCCDSSGHKACNFVASIFSRRPAQLSHCEILFGFQVLAKDSQAHQFTPNLPRPLNKKSPLTTASSPSLPQFKPFLHIMSMTKSES